MVLSNGYLNHLFKNNPMFSHYLNMSEKPLEIESLDYLSKIKLSEFDTILDYAMLPTKVEAIILQEAIKK